MMEKILGRSYRPVLPLWSLVVLALLLLALFVLLSASGDLLLPLLGRAAGPFDYLHEFGVDVSSPGPERPLRKPEHFQRALGRRVKLKTEGRKLRGEVTRADDETVTVAADGGEVDIPYDEIVRGNLIDEKEGR